MDNKTYLVKSFRADGPGNMDSRIEKWINKNSSDDYKLDRVTVCDSRTVVIMKVCKPTSQVINE